MQDESTDKAWWSDLFRGSADPALEVPADVWDSAIGGALDPETPAPDTDVVPPTDAESSTGDDDLGYSRHDSVDHDDMVATDDVHIVYPAEGHAEFGDAEGFDHT